MLTNRTVARLLAVVGAGCCAASASAQIRVAQWNITNWDANSVGDRGAAFQTAIYGVNPANGLSMSPDVLIVQEIVESNPSTAISSFLTLLNTAPNSPGDWAVVPYVANQGDTGNAAFYRTTRVTFVPGSTITLGVSGADVGSGNTQSPRDNQRWTFTPLGYSGEAAKFYVYAAHMKAGSTSTDQQRREPEGLRIRDNANMLPTGSHFMLCGDFNVQNSTQTFYRYLTEFNTMFADVRMIQSGQFFDPIILPGSWENSGTFRHIHTQEPSSQMDSRHDQILISAAMRDGQGLSYLPATPGGNILVPFHSLSGATGMEWYDSNHSYRCWGNDGESFNAPIRTGSNTQVGSAIASALITTVGTGGGHLAVYLDMQVPAKLGAPTSGYDFGTVAQNSAQSTTLQITNGADFALFSKDGTGWGIDALTYSFSFVSGSGFSIQGGNGPFNRAPTNPSISNSHTIVLDTSSQGTKMATLRITSDDPDNPTRDIVLTANVGNGGPPPPPPGNYDVNGDGQVTIEDLHRWYNLFTDVNMSGGVDINDALALRTYLRWYEVQDITAGRR